MPIEPNVVENCAEACNMEFTQNIKPTIAIKKPMMQYATGEQKYEPISLL